MSAPHPITIVGGGLAGLALGIGLRQREVPVTLWEAGSYPRNKVCGEFINGRGQETLDRLGLTEPILHAGGRWARDAAFFVGAKGPVEQRLPRPALCISRSTLDHLLAMEFRRLGGELRERQRWLGDPGGNGTVRATGRRIQQAADGWRWFGLKAYTSSVAMAADLELHAFPDGYVGLCRLADRVNVCGLFRSRHPVGDLRAKWKEFLTGPPGSLLHARLQGAMFDEQSFCAAAGFDLEPRAADEAECSVGDALTMVPPATGNGLSMALEAAELALDPLVQYSGGHADWDGARREIAGALNRRFAPRLRVAARLHRMMFHPIQRHLVWFLAVRFPPALRRLFRRTR